MARIGPILGQDDVGLRRREGWDALGGVRGKETGGSARGGVLGRVEGEAGRGGAPPLGRRQGERHCLAEKGRSSSARSGLVGEEGRRAGDWQCHGWGFVLLLLEKDDACEYAESRFTERERENMAMDTMDTMEREWLETV